MPYPYKFEISNASGTIILSPCSFANQKKLNISEIVVCYQVGLIKIKKTTSSEDKSSIVTAFLDRDKDNKQFVTLYKDVDFIYFFGADKYKSNQLMSDFVDCFKQSIPVTLSFIGDLKESLQEVGYNFYNESAPPVFNPSACPFKLSISGGSCIWIHILDHKTKKLIALEAEEAKLNTQTSWDKQQSKVKSHLMLNNINIDKKGNISIVVESDFSLLKISDYILKAFLKENENYSALVSEDNNQKNISISVDSFDLTNAEKNRIVSDFINAFIGSITISNDDIGKLKAKILSEVSFDVSQKENQNYFRFSNRGRFSMFNDTNFHYGSGSNENNPFFVL